MNVFIAEIVGTFLLMFLGNGVVANVLLKDTKGHASGWAVITVGWGFAVFVGVFAVAIFSGAHINPAVTLGLAVSGKFSWSLVPGYMAAQMVGAALGAFFVWVQYKQHYDVTEDADLKLATFCTAPAIRNGFWNTTSEALATFVLVFGVLLLAAPEVGLGALDALPVALLVLVIGMALGGPTGYAINPARDLAPRIVHAMLPIPGKRDSDWSYAWVPVIGPLLGGLLAAGLYIVLLA